MRCSVIQSYIAGETRNFSIQWLWGHFQDWEGMRGFCHRVGRNYIRQEWLVAAKYSEMLVSFLGPTVYELLSWHLTHACSRCVRLQFSSALNEAGLHCRIEAPPIKSPIKD